MPTTIIDHEDFSYAGGEAEHAPTGIDVSVDEPYSVFSPGLRRWIVILVSISALTSPFGATTFLPAINVLAGRLGITASQINVSITTYMVRNTSLG
jgi:hypothetical protein